MGNKLFSGIMPAMITPFNADGTLKEKSAARIMDWELATGVKGFYVNGATGEGLFLSEQTRMEMAQVSVDVCRGRGVVINHVGAADTQSAIRMARHAGQIGCDAVSSLVPNYFTRYSTQQVLDYYKALYDASGLPVLVYCKGDIGSDDPYTFMQKVMQVEGLIGCKYTMTNFYNMHRITELNGSDINVINGPDEMLICGLTMGADGGIGSTYNLMGEKFIALYNAFRAGEFEAARQKQFEINRVIEVLLRHSCIASIKEVFNMMGMDAGSIAYPGKVFTEEEREQLRAELRQAGLALV